MIRVQEKKKDSCQTQSMIHLERDQNEAVAAAIAEFDEIAQLDRDVGGGDYGTRLVDATHQLEGPNESGKLILPEIPDCNKSSNTTQSITRKTVLRVDLPKQQD